MIEQQPGTCAEMCPEVERKQRLAEGPIHNFEKPENLPWGNSLTLKDTMIKKFQRSSADHELQIPHLVRAPETLLRTIDYIETYIMDQLEEEPWSLSRYLFIWDRYRMIAKDFILQTASLSLTGLWIECHERMARWYVLMDHRMKACEEYQGGHGQQNLESLNNLLKTLDGYYNNPLFTTSSSSTELLHNQGEFYSYLVLVQLGNTDSLNQFLKSVPSIVLSTNEMKLALKVAGVVKRGEYAQFFHLLKIATPLQASLMHKYVADIRLRAIMKLVKASPKQTYYPLTDLIDMLTFDSEEEASSFLALCGIKVDVKEVTVPVDGVETVEGRPIKYAVLDGQNILSLLPTDRNSIPLKPPCKMMMKGIESRLNSYKTSDICQGKV